MIADPIVGTSVGKFTCMCCCVLSYYIFVNATYVLSIPVIEILWNLAIHWKFKNRVTKVTFELSHVYILDVV